MKAAQLTGPKRFEMKDVEVPSPQDGECLIKLEKVSICGSDIRGSYGRIHPEERYPFDVGSPCHEIVGVVVESRTDEFREGQRVIPIRLAGDTGGLSEYITSRADRMVAVPDHGDPSEWVMCQPSGTVLYSCSKMGNMLGKSVLVLGQGAIGLSFTMLTALQGARQVIGVDLLDYRLEYSRQFGATHTVNPSKVDLSEAVAEITGGAGADITVEAAGFPETLDMSFRHVRQFGTVILFGMMGQDRVSVEPRLWMRQQPTIIPTTSASSGDPTTHIKNMVDLKERGLADPGRMITHRLGFNAEDVNRAYEMYEGQQDNVVKVVMSLT